MRKRWENKRIFEMDHEIIKGKIYGNKSEIKISPECDVILPTEIIDDIIGKSNFFVRICFSVTSKRNRAMYYEKAMSDFMNGYVLENRFIMSYHSFRITHLLIAASYEICLLLKLYIIEYNCTCDTPNSCCEYGNGKEIIKFSEINRKYVDMNIPMNESEVMCVFDLQGLDIIDNKIILKFAGNDSTTCINLWENSEHKLRNHTWVRERSQLTNYLNFVPKHSASHYIEHHDYNMEYDICIVTDSIKLSNF